MNVVPQSDTRLWQGIADAWQFTVGETIDDPTVALDGPCVEVTMVSIGLGYEYTIHTYVTPEDAADLQDRFERSHVGKTSPLWRDIRRATALFTKVSGTSGQNGPKIRVTLHFSTEGTVHVASDLVEELEASWLVRTFDPDWATRSRFAELCLYRPQG